MVEWTRSSTLPRLRQIVEAIESVGSQTPFDASVRGNACSLLAFDLYLFSHAVVTLVEAEDWSPAKALQRPLQERIEYLWAAHSDEAFAKEYRESADPEIHGTDPYEPPRVRPGAARGVMRRSFLEIDPIAGEQALLAQVEALRWGSMYVHPTPHGPAETIMYREQPGSDTEAKSLQTVGDMLAAGLAALAVVAQDWGAPSVALSAGREVADDWMALRLGEQGR